MSERDDFGAFLLGFIIGGLSGAVVALLMAPQSGAETRNQIKEKAIELSEEAEKTAKEVAARAGEEADKAKTWAEDTVSKVKDTTSQKLSKPVKLEELPKSPEESAPAVN
jgi:gas vesicle protein